MPEAKFNKFDRFDKLHSVSDGGGTWSTGADLFADFSLSDPIGFSDTHASTIYAPNAAGVFAPYAADVIVRTDLGLQTVPTRMNLLTYSQDFSQAVWSKSGTSIGAAVIAPDGTSTAYPLIENSSNSQHGLVRSAITVVAGSPVTFDVFLKASTRRYAMVRVNDNASNSNAASVVVDLQTMTIVGAATAYGTFTAASAVLKQYSNGWRCELTVTSPVTSVNVKVEMSNNGSRAADGQSISYLGDGASNFSVWNPQLEQAAFASPPIVTAGAAATVNGNMQVKSGLGTQLATGIAGLIQLDALTPMLSKKILTISDGTLNNRIHIEYGAGNNTPRFQQVIAGAVQAASALSAGVSGVFTAAFVFTNGFQGLHVVGGAEITTAQAYPVVDRLTLGGNGANLNDNSYQYTRKLAVDYLVSGEDPATKLAEWYSKALRAA